MPPLLLFVILLVASSLSSYHAQIAEDPAKGLLEFKHVDKASFSIRNAKLASIPNIPEDPKTTRANINRERLLSAWQKHVYEASSLEEFRSVTEDLGRAYHTFVLFLPEDCSERDCLRARETFKNTAKRYWTELQSRRSVRDAPLFFVEFKIDESNASFFAHRRLPEHALPRIVCFPPSDAIPDDYAGLISLKGLSATPVSLDAFVLKHSKFRIPDDSVSFMTMFNKFGVMLFAIQGIFMAYQFRNELYNRGVCLFISLFVYFVSTSGLMYCVMRGQPPFGLSSHGFYLIHPDRSGQFVLEGIIVSILNFFAAGCFLFFTEYYGKSKPVMFFDPIEDQPELPPLPPMEILDTKSFASGETEITQKKKEEVILAVAQARRLRMIRTIEEDRISGVFKYILFSFVGIFLLTSLYRYKNPGYLRW